MDFASSVRHICRNGQRGFCGGETRRRPLWKTCAWIRRRASASLSGPTRLRRGAAAQITCYQYFTTHTLLNPLVLRVFWIFAWDFHSDQAPPEDPGRLTFDGSAETGTGVS